MSKIIWGWHLTIDASGCCPVAMRDYDTVYRFAKQLVKEIDMVAYGEPQIVNFGSGDKAGFTLVQLIETSNICGHFANDIGAIFLDVFSCKEYEAATVERLFDEYFHPISMNIQEKARSYYV